MFSFKAKLYPQFSSMTNKKMMQMLGYSKNFIQKMQNIKENNEFEEIEENDENNNLEAEFNNKFH